MIVRVRFPTDSTDRMLSVSHISKLSSFQRAVYLRSSVTALTTSAVTGRRFQSTTRSKEENPISQSSEKEVSATPASSPKEKSPRPGYLLPPKDAGLSGKFQEDYERIAKYTLLPLTVIPFCTSYADVVFPPMLDAALGSVFLIYTHYGFSSLIYQYLPKEKFPRWSKISLWSLYSSTCLAFYGLYELETESNGVVDLIRKLWNYDESNVFIFGRS